MNEIRTDDESVSVQYAFDDDQYTDKELREQKKQFEKQLLELERLLDKDEWSDEDLDCVRSVKESVKSYTDAEWETDGDEDDVYEEMADDAAEDMVEMQYPFESQKSLEIEESLETEEPPEIQELLETWDTPEINSYSQLLPDRTEADAEEGYFSIDLKEISSIGPTEIPPDTPAETSFIGGEEVFPLERERSFPSMAMHTPSAKAYRDDSFFAKYGVRLLLGVLFSAAVFFICYFQLYSVLLVLLLASAAFGLVLTGFRLKNSADENKQKLTKENDTLKLWNELLEQVNKELGERNAELKKTNVVLEETNGALEGTNEVLKGENRKLDREKRDLRRRIERLEDDNAQLEKQMDQLHDENRKLQKKLARMSEIQEQIRVLKMLIKQIGLTNEEIEEILKMTEDIKKASFSEDRLKWYIAEVLQVAKGRKESALYKKKKEYFTGKEGELFTALSEAAKDFLITAEVMYDLLQDYGSGCDYSSVCLLASKAMEVETRVRYFDSYKIYLDKQFGTDYKKWPKNMLYCGEPASFCSMGNIRRIVTRCDQEGASYIRKNFLIYAKQEMFRDTFEEHMEQEIRFQLDCIDSVRLRYRNPAAHSRLFTSEEAKICLCYIVEDEQVLFHIMKAYKN